MECSHCKLCTRLTDWLSGNNTDSLTDSNRLTVGKVRTVALTASAVFCTTFKYRTNLDVVNTRINDDVSLFVAHHNILWNKNITVRIAEVIKEISSDKTLVESFDNIWFACFDVKDFKTLCSTAVLFTDNNFLWYINKTAGKVTWVGCTKSCIGKTFTSTTRWNKVLQDVKAFTVVSSDRNFDCFTWCIGDKTTHTCKLSDLAHTTTGTWVSHHEDWVVAVKVFLEGIGYIVSSLFPDTKNFFVTLLVWTKTHHKLITNNINFLLCLGNNRLLLGRNNCVTNGNGNSTLCRILIALCLNVVKNNACSYRTVNFDTFINNLLKTRFTNEEVNLKLESVFGDTSVDKAEILRNRIVKDNLTDCCVYNTGFDFSVNFKLTANLDFWVKLNDACLISHHNFINITEYLSFASLTVLIKCKVVRTEDHILCRNCNRLTVRRLEKVACCEHKESCFCLCLCRKRYMDSHLVAVKVSVVCCTS